MLKHILVSLVALSIAFPVGAFAGAKNKKPPVTEQPATDIELDMAQPQTDSKQKDMPQPITQEEYDKKMKSAKNLSTAGLVTAGVGGALVVGGIIYVAAKSSSNNNNSFSGLSAWPGAVMFGVGLPIALTGGGLLIAGSTKKHNLKERQIISLSPSIDPANSRYGLALSTNF